MILRNHGLVTLGSTIEEAFEYMYNLILACQSQVNNILGGINFSVSVVAGSGPQLWDSKFDTCL